MPACAEGNMRMLVTARPRADEVPRARGQARFAFVRSAFKMAHVTGSTVQPARCNDAVCVFSVRVCA